MKIWFDKNLINNSPWPPFLIPFLGENIYELGNSYDCFDDNQKIKRNKIGNKLLKFTQINECDYIVFPKLFFMDFFDEVKYEAKKAKKFNKKLLVFYNGDIEIPFNIENTIIFRTSLRNGGPMNEIPIPAFIKPIPFLKNNFIDDLFVSYVGYGGENTTKLKIKNWIRNILVGSIIEKYFCEITNFLSKFIKDSWCINPEHKMDTLGFLLFQFERGKNIRYNSLLNLKQKYPQTNLVIRDKMFRPTVLEKIRNEYIDNMINSIFCLVMRGDGNFSFRLYEVMSAGRIPVFIDTDCKLPFENEINYKDLFVRVPYNDIKNIDTYIIRYIEKNKSNLGYIQNQIYNTYMQFLYMPSFFEKTIKMIENK